MCVLLAGCRLRGHCGRGLLGARDHQGYEHHRHDERPHGRENSGETSNRCKDASGNRPSGQKQCAGQDEDAAADECAEPEDEAAVPTPNQPNRLRDSCGDKQAAEKEPEPPGPAVHLPTVSAQPRAGPCLSVGDHPLRRLAAPRAGHAAIGRTDLAGQEGWWETRPEGAWLPTAESGVVQPLITGLHRPCWPGADGEHSKPIAPDTSSSCSRGSLSSTRAGWDVRFQERTHPGRVGSDVLTSLLEPVQ